MMAQEMDLDPDVPHRKQWEWLYIASALFEREKLNPGLKGLGFAVGKEPLPALFARHGCDILATDLHPSKASAQGWDSKNEQHADTLMDLNKPHICDSAIFFCNTSYAYVDMNNIPARLNNSFDFCWSSCALEHLGNIENGIKFVINSLKCLKSGGVAVHTTEYNVFQTKKR